MILERAGHVQVQPVIVGCGTQRPAVEVDQELLPAQHGPVQDALFLVHQSVQPGLVDAAQPGAGGAGALGLVEGEVRHDQLGHLRAALRAGIGRSLAAVFFLLRRQALPPGHSGIKRGRHILTAAGAGPVPQPGEEHAQVGVHLGDRAHRGARALIGQVLVDGDGRRQPGDGLDRRAGHIQADHAQRFHVLPLAFLEQDIEPQRGLARAGKPGQHHQPVSGDLDGNILEIMQPGAADRNWSVHWPSRGLTGRRSGPTG